MVSAAHLLGLDEVPCIVLAHLTPAQRRAYVLADNKLALNAGWDLEMLLLEIGELGEAGFDLSLTGFDEFELRRIIRREDSEGGGDRRRARHHAGAVDFNEAGVPAQTSIFVPRHQLAEELREVIECALRERGEAIRVPIQDFKQGRVDFFISAMLFCGARDSG